MMEKIAKDYIQAENEDEIDIQKALNDFIYGVIEQYSTLFLEKYNERKILPIGFLPSNVLANYALRNFDKAVLDGWNPVYYGRYVDDILIVEKIEDRSDLHVRARDNTLTKDIVLHFFLEDCATWKGYKGINCSEKCAYSLFTSDMVPMDTETNTGESNSCDKDKKKKVYHLNKAYNSTDDADEKTEIDLHDDKVKVFYFKAGETDALITCFKKEIGRNKSEFRHMPEDEVVFQRDDYSMIYNLKNSETVNKFRGITELSIDKFELSKLLGKHLRIAGMVTDQGEYQLFQHLKKIFNHRVIIENYTVWEKIIEVLVINEAYTALTDFVKDVYDSIEKTSFVEKEKQYEDVELQESLKEHLVASISRACALVWNDKMTACLEDIYKTGDKNKEKEYNETKKCVLKRRERYCSARMIDKSVMPVLIDLLDIKKLYIGNCNLSNFTQVMDVCKDQFDCVLEYKYHPYLVNSYDISNMKCMLQLKGIDSFSDFEKIYAKQYKEYIKINYRLEENGITEGENSVLAGKGVIHGKAFNYLQIMNENRSKLKIGVANVKLDHHNFECVVKDKANRSYKRYAELSRVVNMAIDEDVDLLVMPEAYLPIEWLNTLARTCAKNEMAVITGVEHVKVPASEKKRTYKKEESVIYNLTAVILPFVEKQYQSKNAVIAYHLKNHYAPLEKMEINGYRLREMKGDGHELYKWHGCYFSVFCCYELASISDRALFQSVVDFLVAIEWNKDVPYFSNIMESLSRDVHSYCVQVNTSEYGDSRITAPVKSEKKDIVRTKGGINSTILVGEIDIGALREFQIKEYPLQKQDDSFKPTPPGFEPNKVMRKIKGEKVFDEAEGIGEFDETPNGQKQNDE